MIKKTILKKKINENLHLANAKLSNQGYIYIYIMFFLFFCFWFFHKTIQSLILRCGKFGHLGACSGWEESWPLVWMQGVRCFIRLVFVWIARQCVTVNLAGNITGGQWHGRMVTVMVSLYDEFGFYLVEIEPNRISYCLVIQ